MKNVESKILTHLSLEWPADTVSHAEIAEYILTIEQSSHVSSAMTLFSD